MAAAIEHMNTANASNLGQLSDFQRQFVPEKKEYALVDEYVYQFKLWASQSEPLWISGPTGCGKTTFVEQMGARLGIPMLVIAAHGQYDVADLLGETGAVRGSTYHQDGPLPMAMENGLTLVIDEGDTPNPAIMIAMHGPLEGRPLYLNKAGRTVHPHPDFRVIIVANTKGLGEGRALHRGTQTFNSATLNRFWKMRYDYLPKEQESEAIRINAHINKSIADKLADIATDVRAAHDRDELSFSLSTRELIRWAELSKAYKHLVNQGGSPFLEGAKLAFLNGTAVAEDVDAFKAIINARGI